MKLIVCIINNRDKNKLSEQLIKEGFEFTIISSIGGFLKQSNTTILIGVEDKLLEKIFEIIAQNCQPREEVTGTLPIEAGLAGVFMQAAANIHVGGATVFVLNIEQFERF